MASKRHVRRKSCEGKIKYLTMEDARNASGRARRLGTGSFTAYKCKFCEYYHKGHKAKPKRRYE